MFDVSTKLFVQTNIFIFSFYFLCSVYPLYTLTYILLLLLTFHSIIKTYSDRHFHSFPINSVLHFLYSCILFFTKYTIILIENGKYLVDAWPTYARPMVGMGSHTRDLGMNSHSFLFLFDCA